MRYCLTYILIFLIGILGDIQSAHASVQENIVKQKDTFLKVCMQSADPVAMASALSSLGYEKGMEVAGVAVYARDKTEIASITSQQNSILCSVGFYDLDLSVASRDEAVAALEPAMKNYQNIMPLELSTSGFWQIKTSQGTGIVMVRYREGRLTPTKLEFNVLYK